MAPEGEPLNISENRTIHLKGFSFPVKEDSPRAKYGGHWGFLSSDFLFHTQYNPFLLLILKDNNVPDKEDQLLLFQSNEKSSAFFLTLLWYMQQLIWETEVYQSPDRQWVAVFHEKTGWLPVQVLSRKAAKEDTLIPAELKSRCADQIYEPKEMKVLTSESRAWTGGSDCETFRRKFLFFKTRFCEEPDWSCLKKL